MATEKEYDNWFARGYKPHTYNTHGHTGTVSMLEPKSAEKEPIAEHVSIDDDIIFSTIERLDDGRTGKMSHSATGRGGMHSDG